MHTLQDSVPMTNSANKELNAKADSICFSHKWTNLSFDRSNLFTQTNFNQLSILFCTQLFDSIK